MARKITDAIEEAVQDNRRFFAPDINDIITFTIRRDGF